MPDRPENALRSPLIYNRFVLMFKSMVNTFVYSILSFFKSSQFRARAYCNSWIILRAFDSRSFKKRIVILCATVLALIISLMVILTAV
jgi:hypothetical protein